MRLIKTKLKKAQKILPIKGNMDKKMVVLVLAFLLTMSSFPVLAQESVKDDCTWLCQVVEWFKSSHSTGRASSIRDSEYSAREYSEGEETVVGEA